MRSTPLRAFLFGHGPLTAKSWANLSAPGIQNSQPPLLLSSSALQSRSFRKSPPRIIGADLDETAEKANKKSLDEQESNLEDAVAQQKDKQQRAPWHREGTELPPVARPRSAGAMTKGKLLTTPSRLLKLILPLTTLDKNSDRKDVEPLALLVHPQQPLSYLERLIQSELPTLKDKQGEDKIPRVHFRAEDSQQDEIKPKSKTPAEEKKTNDDEYDEGDLEETKFGGQTERTGKLRPITEKAAANPALGEGGVESYSGLGREGPSAEETRSQGHFVRWSSSTEIGDFIRDAARGKEFAVEIEGATKEIRVGVPSFNDRTYYLRTRMRKASGQILGMTKIKQECDIAAHKAGQRVAMGGAGLLFVYWYVVYRLTFETDLGWDTMEPVTYLVGLSTLICGYLWFLYHNREVSYRSAMNLTVSRRQNKLYQQKGFDVRRWETLTDEANALRKEIKAVAREYDVDWDEKVDERDEKVTEALKEIREDQKAKDGGKSKKSDEDED